MLKAVILSLILMAGIINIYDLKIKSIDGQKIDFSAFKGKKILIVNIALGSSYSSQLVSLETLQLKYKDSVVVIAIPSNSFGEQTMEEKEFKQKLKGYQTSFIVAEKMEVKGGGKSALYQWLQETNGRIKKEVMGDFHKFLIGSNGELMGYFIPAVDPMSEIIQRAIEGKTTTHK